MQQSPYEDYWDITIPDSWRKLLGKCGAYEGYRSHWPKTKPPKEYGIPESEALTVALWSFIRLPFYVQMCLIDEHMKRSGGEL